MNLYQYQNHNYQGELKYTQNQYLLNSLLRSIFGMITFEQILKKENI